MDILTVILIIIVIGLSYWIVRLKQYSSFFNRTIKISEKSADELKKDLNIKIAEYQSLEYKYKELKNAYNTTYDLYNESKQALVHLKDDLHNKSKQALVQLESELKALKIEKIKRGK